MKKLKAVEGLVELSVVFGDGGFNRKQCFSVGLSSNDIAWLKKNRYLITRKDNNRLMFIGVKGYRLFNRIEKMSERLSIVQ